MSSVSKCTLSFWFRVSVFCRLLFVQGYPRGGGGQGVSSTLVKNDLLSHVFLLSFFPFSFLSSALTSLLFHQPSTLPLVQLPSSSFFLFLHSPINCTPYRLSTYTILSLDTVLDNDPFPSQLVTHTLSLTPPLHPGHLLVHSIFIYLLNPFVATAPTILFPSHRNSGSHLFPYNQRTPAHQPIHTKQQRCQSWGCTLESPSAVSPYWESAPGSCTANTVRICGSKSPTSNRSRNDSSK